MLKKKLPFARKAIIGVALMPGILLGGVASVSAVHAAPTSSVYSSSSVVAVAEAKEIRAATAAAPVSSGSTAVQVNQVVASSGEKRINIGPVITWIKNNASWLWNALVNAVKAGWNAFVNWWNGLASWIRWSIQQIAGASLWEIFVALRHYILGW